MFGTIVLLKPKPGQEQAVIDLFEEWWRERRPKVHGAMMNVLYRNAANPAELMGAVVFESREAYQANANDPEQDRWYRRLLEHLEGEPRWIDGEVLSAHVA